MADSSDESVPPKDFQVLSSTDSNGLRSIGFSQIRCNLCHQFQKNFTCKQCIKIGDFVKSTSGYERFSEKQLRLLRLKNSRQAVEELCMEKLEKRIKYDKLITDIRNCKENIELLKRLFEIKKKHRERNNKRLNDLVEDIKQRKFRLPKYAIRVAQIERYIEGKNEEIGTMRRGIDEKYMKLKEMTRAICSDLTKYVFPITLVEQKSNECNLNEGHIINDNTMLGLVDAQSIEYVRGQWVEVASDLTTTSQLVRSKEAQYQINGPLLSSSGDYSAYYSWLAYHKETASPQNSNLDIPIEQNVAYTISAGLANACQLVQIIASLLDVSLPYKLKYTKFFNISDLKEKEFTLNVAKLNLNILYLCFKQNVNLKYLKPYATIHNILCLLNTNISDLGRRGPIIFNGLDTFKLEQPLLHDLALNQDSISSSDDDDILPWEWETVPHSVLQDDSIGGSSTPSHHSSASSGISFGQYNQLNNPAQTQSMASGLVTSAAASIASFWRGWAK